MDHMQPTMMSIDGMQSGGCVNKLSLAFNRVAGVDDVQISLASGETTVRYDENKTSPAKLKEMVIATGVDGVAATNGHDPRPNYCG
jgi:copper chaperone CopZ